MASVKRQHTDKPDARWMSAVMIHPWLSIYLHKGIHRCIHTMYMSIFTVYVKNSYITSYGSTWSEMTIIVYT